MHLFPPEGPITRLDRRDLFHLAIVLLLATATRIYKLGYASLWLDEATTIPISSFPWSKLWISAYDPTPPLYYSVIHMLLNFGHSEFLLRLPSAACGVLTVAVMYFATRKIAGSLAAFAASLILALSIHNIEYSQEARAYALLGLCLSVSFYGVTSLCTRWQSSTSAFTFYEFIKSGAGLYALGLIAALYTHNTAIFFWVGVQFFFLAWWLQPFTFSRSCITSWFVINLCVVLLWLPWLFASLEVLETGSFSWLKQFGAGQAFSTWRRVHGMQSALSGQPYIDLFILLLGLAGLYSLRRRYALVGLLLGLLVSSSIFIWLYGFFASPIYMLRSILWGSLFSAVLVGIGVGALPMRLGYGVILLILVGGTAGVFDYYENNRAENEDWRSAALLVKNKYRPNDIILFRAPYVSKPFSYYFGEFSPSGEILGWNCGQEQLLSGQVRRNGQRLKVSWTKFEPEAKQQIAKKPGASLWIIESHCNPQSWDRADAILFPNWVLQKTYDVKGMLVHRMVSSGPRTH